jgi:DNA-binding MarR family transcriptional regulator
MTAGHHIAMALRIAYLTMHRRADAQFGRLGVTADQYVVLAALAQEDAVSQQELVGRTCSDPNTIGAMLVLLERRSLVRRGRHPTDRRARSVTLTPKGRQTYKNLWAAGATFRRRLRAAFGADEIDALIEFLGRVTHAASLPDKPPRRRRAPAAGRE